MYGQIELNTLLKDPSITALLSSPNSIWNSVIIPDKGPRRKTINYYRAGPVIGEDWLDVPYSVNCRAPKQSDAEEIARAVRDVLNRHSSGSVFFVCAVLSVIGPQDSTDNFNAPVEVTAKGRNV